MNSPTFMAIWLYIIGMIPIGVASIKNKASAAKFIAVFNHGIEVLSLAVAQLQAVVDAPTSASAKAIAAVSTSKHQDPIDVIRQLVA